MAPVNLVMHFPKTEEGQAELARLVSEVHAAAVIRQVNTLNCPTNQKQVLLNEIIEIVKKNSRERT